MAEPRVGLKQILAAKRAVKAAVARRAARKYTWVWNKIIKEAQGIDPKQSLMPQGFKGTQNQKYQRALLYRNRIINWAHRHKKRMPLLFRGIKGWERNQMVSYGQVHKNTLSSFTTDYKVAEDFAGPTGAVMILRTKKTQLPVINFANKNFQSEWAPGGKKFDGYDEKEVLLPPGTFERMRLRRMRLRRSGPGYITIYHVKYTPDKINTSYLHAEPQRDVAGKNKTGKYVYKDPTTGNYYKIKDGGERVSASPPPVQKKKTGVSLGTNSKGRTIHKGIKGGTYVMSSRGKKLYKTVLAVGSSTNTFGTNSKGRTIYKGPKGGFYVMNQKGKKSYKFIY